MEPFVQNLRHGAAGTPVERSDLPASVSATSYIGHLLTSLQNASNSCSSQEGRAQKQTCHDAQKACPNMHDTSPDCTPAAPRQVTFSVHLAESQLHCASILSVSDIAACVCVVSCVFSTYLVTLLWSEILESILRSWLQRMLNTGIAFLQRLYAC